MTLPTEDVASLVAFANEMACYFEKRPTGGEDSAHWSNVANAETSRKIATALSTLAGERDATIANYHELNKVSLEVISERDDALRKAAFWEKFSGVLQDDADKFKARALASEARATTAEAQVVADERRFEQIRTILVNHLDEPERAAFWIAVEGRDAARAALLAGTPPSGAETQEKVDGN